MNQNRTKLSTDASSLLQQAASDSAGLVWIPYSSNLFPIAQDLVEQGYLIAQVAGRMNAIPTYGGHPVASEMGISFKITSDGYNYLVSTGKSTKEPQFSTMLIGGILQSVPPVKKAEKGQYGNVFDVLDNMTMRPYLMRAYRGVAPMPDPNSDPNGYSIVQELLDTDLVSLDPTGKFYMVGSGSPTERSIGMAMQMGYGR